MPLELHEEEVDQTRTGSAPASEAAERMQLALSAGRLGDWSWNPNNDLVKLGPEAAEVFGLEPAREITWDSLRELLHPEDREKARKAVEESLATHRDYEIEYRVRKDARYAWIAARGRPIYRADGSVSGMVGVVQDITRHKDAEQIRSRLAAVVESSDDAIISMSLDTTILTWNKGAQRMFGFTPEEAIGRSVSMLIPEDSEDEEPEIFRRLLTGERIDHYETIRRRKDGTLLNISLTVSPVYDDSGRVVGVSKISRDITDRKRSEKALQEQARTLELLNSTGKVIASQLDLQGVVQTVTDSATQLTGAEFGSFFYNVANQEGESFLLFALSGAPREAFENFGHPRATPLFAPTFKGEGPLRSDDVTKDPRYGQWGPHHGMPKGHLPVRSYLAVPVISRTGEVIGGLFFGHSKTAIFTDRAEKLVLGMAAQAAIAIDNARLYDAAQREITRRRNVEEALREAQNELQRHAERLEEQVTERTARLRETIHELEAFSYSISHDMRSPLRAMQGYADALLEDYEKQFDPTAKEYLQRIRRAAGRMDLLIQDVLAYSRVAKGEIQLRPINVENVIRDVIQNYPALQPEHADIRLVTEIPLVLGHEAYLTQIVSNFLGNAVKFVERGKRAAINISARIEDDMVRIGFQDNGIGIAEEHQNQIFQIFGRVYPEKKYEGTGIGLAIAKKAAERMGGTIGVISQLGRGSEFYFILKKA
jgi:PAS domain S-box-containing protein